MASNDMDSDPNAGTPSSPKGGSSDEKGDSSGSFDAQKLQTTLETLTKRLEEVDARSKALQGDKDRGIAKTQNEVDELKRKFAEIEKLKKSGYDDDAAFEELGFREEVRSVKEQLSNLKSAPAQTAGNGDSQVVDAAKVIKDYGLDGNDPEVVEKVLKGEYKTPMEAELAALKLAYRRATSAPPSAGAAPTLQGEAPKLSPETNTLIDRLKVLQKTPTQNREEIISLKTELDKRGWK